MKNAGKLLEDMGAGCSYNAGKINDKWCEDCGR
jgi:hypothetical protein